METVTGVEPALMELQSIAFPLGYTVIVGYMLQFRYYCRERKQTMQQRLNVKPICRMFKYIYDDAYFIRIYHYFAFYVFIKDNREQLIKPFPMFLYN